MAHIDRQARFTFRRFVQWLGGGKEPKQPASVEPEKGFVRVFHDRTVKVVVCTVASVVPFLRSFASKQGGKVEEITDGISVTFSRVDGLVIPWSPEAKRYVSYAGIVTPGLGLGHKPESVPVQPRSRLAAVIGSPWSIEKVGPEPVPIQAEDGVMTRSPFSNQESDSVQQPQARKRVEIDSPWSINREEEPSQPSVVDNIEKESRKGKVSRAPWSMGTP